MQKLDQDMVDLLFDLYRRGEYAALAERTQSLLKSYPRELVLHSLRGAACHELHEYEAAVASYRAALAIRPDFEKIHNSLGIAYLRTERVDEALEAFRSALNCNPGFAPAWFNAGIAFEHLKEWRHAADCYERAAQIEPGYVEALSSLATVLLELDDYDRIVDVCEQALAVKPDHLPAWRNLMNFLERANRHEELDSVLQRAQAVLGEHALVKLFRGLTADIRGDAGQARSILESFRFDTTDPAGQHDERRRLARLARICDRLDDPRAAAGYAAEANRLSHIMSTRAGVHKETYLEYIDYRRGCFTGDYVARWSRPEGASPEPAPVFIIGFPRSGTTLLDTVLRGHPDVAVAEESDAVSRMVDRMATLAGDPLAHLPELSRSELQQLRQLYFDTLHARLPGAAPDARLVDRFALNIIYAGEICRIFPDARFVLVLRHPADCVLSCFMQTFTESPANANFHDLKDAAHLYDRVFSLWRQYEEVLQPASLAVRYEDMVAGLETALRPVLDFIDVPWHPDLLDYQRTARERPFIRTASYNQVIRPLYTDAAGRWRRYRDFLQPVMPVLEPWINHYGYSSK